MLGTGMSPPFDDKALCVRVISTLTGTTALCEVQGSLSQPTNTPLWPIRLGPFFTPAEPSGPLGKVPTAATETEQVAARVGPTNRRRPQSSLRFSSPILYRRKRPAAQSVGQPSDSQGTLRSSPQIRSKPHQRHQIPS